MRQILETTCLQAARASKTQLLCLFKSLRWSTMWHAYSSNLEKHTRTHPSYTCICACVVAYNDMLFSCRIQIDHIRPPCTSSLPFTIYQSKVRQLPTAIGGQQKSTKHAEGSKKAQASRGRDQGDTNTQQQTQQQQGPTSGGWRNRGRHRVVGVSLPKNWYCIKHGLEITWDCLISLKDMSLILWSREFL